MPSASTLYQYSGGALTETFDPPVATDTSQEDEPADRHQHEAEILVGLSDLSRRRFLQDLGHGHV